MNQVSTVGLDLAKYIFQLHGADSAGAVVFRKKLRRGQLLAFLATLPPCTVAMEACGSAHYWGREIAKLGHMVKLIAPAYVKPFVKRQKNAMADTEAICEAAQRPTLRFVALNSRARTSRPPPSCCENALQWVLDVTFREDDSRVRDRTAARKFALLRKIALNLVANDRSTQTSLRGKRKKAAWDDGYMLQILAHQAHA